MKKLLFVLLVLCMSLTACSKNEENVVGGPGSTWDCVEYTNIEDMNAVANTNIVSAPVSGKADEWFGVISGNIAQYKFTVNGQEWCVRASKDVDNDISGLNYESIDFEKDVNATYYTDDYYANRFFYDDTQYVIFTNVSENSIAMTQFDEICGEFKTNITGVKSGYEFDLFAEGNDVIYVLTMYNDDGTKIITRNEYKFENDKMTSIVSTTTFESEELLNDYIELLKEYGTTIDDDQIEGTSIVSVTTEDLDYYNEYNQASFLEMMQNSLQQ